MDPRYERLNLIRSFQDAYFFYALILISLTFTCRAPDLKRFRVRTVDFVLKDVETFILLLNLLVLIVEPRCLNLNTLVVGPDDDSTDEASHDNVDLVVLKHVYCVERSIFINSVQDQIYEQ